MVVNVRRYLERTALRVYLIPNPRIRIIIVSYRFSHKILAADMKLLSERPEAFRGTPRSTASIWTSHLATLRFIPDPGIVVKNVHIQHIFYFHHPDKSRSAWPDSHLVTQLSTTRCWLEHEFRRFERVMMHKQVL
jgi:hypothetical protein